MIYFFYYAWENSHSYRMLFLEERIMGMTMTQKILAKAAGLPKVEAGQLIEAKLDLVLGNDITSPVAIKEMEKMKVDGVFDKDKIALVPDHFVPNKDIKSAEHCKCVREFARRNEITNYFEVGQMGIEHARTSRLETAESIPVNPKPFSEFLLGHAQLLPL